MAGCLRIRYKCSMSNIASRNVNELPESSRQGIELLLGTELKPNERVYIVVDVPPAGPTQPVRIRAAKRIREIIALSQANADAEGLSNAEVHGAINEAMNHVRPRD